MMGERRCLEKLDGRLTLDARGDHEAHEGEILLRIEFRSDQDHRDALHSTQAIK